MTHALPFVLGWIAATSLITFSAYGWDKRAARRRARRVPEFRLLGGALFGGGPGAFLGMLCFRHKTRRAVFWLAAWVGIALDLALVRAAL